MLNKGDATMSGKRNKLIFTLVFGAVLSLAVCATTWLMIRNLGAIISLCSIESSLPLGEILSQLSTAQIRLPMITVLLISFSGCGIFSCAKKNVRMYLILLLYLPLACATLCMTEVNSIRFVDAVKTILLFLNAGI